MRDTILMLNAPKYLPTDDGLIPTGEVKSVEGTPLDFTTAKPIGQDIDKVAEPQFHGGYDHCFVLADKARRARRGDGRVRREEGRAPARAFKDVMG